MKEYDVTCKYYPPHFYQAVAWHFSTPEIIRTSTTKRQALRNLQNALEQMYKAASRSLWSEIDKDIRKT